MLHRLSATTHKNEVCLGASEKHTFAFSKEGIKTSGNMIIGIWAKADVSLE